MDENTYARFWAKVNKDGPVPAKRPDLGPCWLWKPQGSMGGYGQFYLDGKPQLAHRAAYKILVGPIPDGLTIDHLCSVRHCVRATHLEAVTLAENLRRAETWKNGAEASRAKTRCPNGHEYDEANTRITPSGRRACRACARDRAAAQRQRRRQAKPQPRPLKEFCANGHPFAEFGVIRGGKRVCAACTRERVRRSRAKKRAASPIPPKLTCKNGHPWTDDNIYVSPRGQRSCRICHNEASLAAYHERKSAKPPQPKARRETCRNGHPWIPENLYRSAAGRDLCRICRLEASRRHEARKFAERAVTPKQLRTQCRKGHGLTGDNLHVTPQGKRVCRQCQRDRHAARQARIAAGSPPVLYPGRGNWQRDKTYCKNGHEFTLENTIIRPDGGRKCRECGRLRSREFMRRKRAA